MTIDETIDKIEGLQDEHYNLADGEATIDRRLGIHSETAELLDVLKAKVLLMQRLVL